MTMLPQNVLFDLIEGDPIVPAWFPPAFRDFLQKVKGLGTIRCSRSLALRQEYESSEPEIIERYRPAYVKPELWERTRELMLHMNTTRIAVRTLLGVYSGTQTRRVSGSGQYVEQINSFVNSTQYRKGALAHFLNSILIGTSLATPIYDPPNDELHMIVHDPIRTYIYTSDWDIMDTVAIVEFDLRRRYIRFITRDGAGVILDRTFPKKDQVAFYSESLPYLLTSIAYGEDRRPFGEKYGGSMVGPTPGFNRILTNCYYCLGLLIKWQSRSLLMITGDKGGTDALPQKIVQIAGNTALLLGENGKGEFISPAAKFTEILAVINSYLGFLAVLLGIPKSIFFAQDNVSAQGARLEGAPLLSSMRQLATDSEDNEKDFIYRTAAYLHLRNERRVIPMRDLRGMYDVAVQIEPWDYTDDPMSNANAIVSYVKSGIMRLRDAVAKANPGMTENEIDAFIEEQQREAVKASEAAAAAAIPIDAGTTSAAGGQNSPQTHGGAEQPMPVAA
jgi:hypothetical protein